MISRRQHGFTLTELMVAISIIGLLAAMSVPPVRAYRESLRVEGAASELAAMVRSAQARARSRNHGIIIQYDLSLNEVVVTDDTNNNSVADSGEESRKVPISDGVSLLSSTFASDCLVFNSRGRAVNGGTLSLAGNSHQGKEMRVSPGTGQVKVQTPGS